MALSKNWSEYRHGYGRGGVKEKNWQLHMQGLCINALDYGQEMGDGDDLDRSVQRHILLNTTLVS